MALEPLKHYTERICSFFRLEVRFECNLITGSIARERSAPSNPILAPARALAPLHWVRDEQKAGSRLWNEFIDCYHYLSHKPLPGAQLRYLIYSAQQPIDALGFSATASSAGITLSASVGCT
ncbi:hypothetical protein [Methylotuvimicrobium sp.]|uniref:hypothetical protein n=1 Tax=Methylotuvimicrobium sp. TaxID=2822413 RepID=UPI003D64990F